MDNLKEIIYDITSGQTTERAYTAEEIEEVKKATAKLQKEAEEIQKKAEIRNSALAKLAALGLTEEEIAAL
jgi:D-ribose pyranose/furanose isomerase RbsD